MPDANPKTGALSPPEKNNMPVADLLLEGVKLMLLGMGTVFTFLMLLVVAMAGMSRLARILEPAATPVVDTPQTRTRTMAGSRQDPDLVAVISAAIRHYRATNR